MLSATFSLASRLPVALRFPSKIQQAAFSRQALRQSDVFKCSQAASQLVSQSVSQFVYVPSGRFTISHIPYTVSHIPYKPYPYPFPLPALAALSRMIEGNMCFGNYAKLPFWPTEQQQLYSRCQWM